MLSESLKKLLANSYAFVVKSQQFHWNVEGPNFPQYHQFFGNLYEEVYSSIDKTAEHIRTLNAYTPGSMERFVELSDIKGQLMIPKAELMFTELVSDNEIVIQCLNECFKHAGQERHYGIENYLAERIEAHTKHRWMLKSVISAR
jgi:starvation-inducible DNA-binding protein